MGNFLRLRRKNEYTTRKISVVNGLLRGENKNRWLSRIWRENLKHEGHKVHKEG
jgi:hypothetical protein